MSIFRCLWWLLSGPYRSFSAAGMYVQEFALVVLLGFLPFRELVWVFALGPKARMCKSLASLVPVCGWVVTSAMYVFMLVETCPCCGLVFLWSVVYWSLSGLWAFFRAFFLRPVSCLHTVCGVIFHCYYPFGPFIWFSWLVLCYFVHPIMVFGWSIWGFLYSLDLLFGL